MRELRAMIVAKETHTSEDSKLKVLRDKIIQVEGERDELRVQLANLQCLEAKKCAEKDEVSQVLRSLQETVVETAESYKADAGRLRDVLSADLLKSQEECRHLREQLDNSDVTFWQEKYKHAELGWSKAENQLMRDTELRDSREAAKGLLEALQSELAEIKAREQSIPAVLTTASDQITSTAGESASSAHGPEREDAITSEIETAPELIIMPMDVLLFPPVSTQAHGTFDSSSKSQGIPVFVAVENPVEENFTPLAVKTVKAVKALKKSIPMPNLRIVKAKEFVWIECPDTGFFMKPSVHWPMSEKGEKKINNKKKAVDRLHRNPSNELVLKLTSGLYYLGSYAVDGPENLSREEFEELPSKAQQDLICETGCRNDHTTIQELYHSGRITATKFPVRRIGFNTTLHTRLQIPKK